MKNGTFGRLKVSICGYRCDHLQSAAVIKAVKVSLKSAPHMLDVDFFLRLQNFPEEFQRVVILQKRRHVYNILICELFVFIFIYSTDLYINETRDQA